MKLLDRWLHKPGYSQEQLAEQIRQVSSLMNLRLRTDTHDTEAIRRMDAAVEAAQEVLAYMLDEVRPKEKSSTKN